MTVFTRPERTGVGVVVIGVFAAVPLLSLVVKGSTASTGGSAGAMGATGTTAGLGMMGGAGMGGTGMGGAGGMGAVAVPLLLLTLVAALALGYVGIRAVAAADEGARPGEAVDDDRERDPVARIQRRYTEGELTEDEFERALERELSDEPVDGDFEDESASTGRSVAAREK